MHIVSHQNNSVKENDVVVIGVPFDGNSSYARGAASAPAKIKEALFCHSSNLCTEEGNDLDSLSCWHIAPDLALPGKGNVLQQVERETGSFLQKKLKIVALGGDHSITLPIIRSYAREYPQLNILHLDAHPDLYDELDGNRYSHACPFARIMEEKLVKRLVQVGIRTMTSHQHDQAGRFGVEVIEMRNLEQAKKLMFDGPVYVSLDLDCLDPAFAPGVSHHEPGGMSTREVLEVLQNLSGQVVGADIVEYNPQRDINGMTGMVAAKFLKELIAKIIAR